MLILNVLNKGTAFDNHVFLGDSSFPYAKDTSYGHSHSCDNIHVPYTDAHRYYCILDGSIEPCLWAVLGNGRLVLVEARLASADVALAR